MFLISKSKDLTSLDSTQPNDLSKSTAFSEQPNGSVSDKSTSRRKRSSRYTTSPADDRVRKAQKRRDVWARRRELIETKMLGIAGIVFLLLFIHVGAHLLIDQYIPFLNEILFAIAVIAVGIWGLFWALELFTKRQYKQLSKSQRTERMMKARRLQNTVQTTSRKEES